MSAHGLPLFLSMKILAIDPSVNNVGVAFYDTETEQLKTTCFHPKRNKDTTVLAVAKQIVSHLHLNGNGRGQVDAIVIEQPNWQGSTKGLIAMQQGYTLDLAFLVGYLSSWLWCPLTFLPTPMQWKGTVPKAATKKRVERRFGELQVSEHEYDAIGMIMWLLDSDKIKER